MCNHIVAIFTSLFAFICGNFVLLLAGWQHPSACARVSFGALPGVPSLRCSPFEHLQFRRLSNKASSRHPLESNPAPVGAQCRLFASGDLVCVLACTCMGVWVYVRACGQQTVIIIPCPAIIGFNEMSPWKVRLCEVA